MQHCLPSSSHLDQWNGGIEMIRQLALCAAVTSVLLASQTAQADPPRRPAGGYGPNFESRNQDRLYRENLARQETVYRPWGGPTTTGRWYPNGGFSQQSIQFYPVYPAYGPGYPGYGYGGFGWPYTVPGPVFYGWPAGQHTYIHREIYIP